jgi:hypothetical protein
MIPNRAISTVSLHNKSECQILLRIAHRWRFFIVYVLLEVLHASLYLCEHNAYETHGQNGVVVAAYVKENDDGFVLNEVISYPRTINGVTFHRNCSLYNEYFGHRSRAERAAERIVLGTPRTVYLPVHRSDHECVDKDYKDSPLTFGILHLTVVFLFLAVMCSACRRVKHVELPTAEEIAVTVVDPAIASAGDAVAATVILNPMIVRAVIVGEAPAALGESV